MIAVSGGGGKVDGTWSFWGKVGVGGKGSGSVGGNPEEEEEEEEDQRGLLSRA